jgi:hypothetical protein
VYTVFFGLDILCLAYLVLQSRFVPRAIGVLLAIDGVAYLVYSFADLLVPGFAAHLVPWIQLPAPIAEGGFQPVAPRIRGQHHVVDDEGRRGSPLGLEQRLEHSPELMMSLLAESPGGLVLEVLDGGPTGFDAGFALPGQDNELGASVTRAGRRTT